MKPALQAAEVSKEASPEELLSSLRKYGVVKIIGYLDNVDGVKDDVNRALDSKKTNKYPFGVAFKFGPLRSQEERFPHIYKEFKKEWMKALSEKYLCSNVDFCHQIMATRDYVFDGKVARNGYLHFDRSHEFKFFLYLSDCGIDDGPLSCVLGSHILGKKLRKKAWEATSVYSKVRNRVFVDYDDMLEYKGEITPILANAGDLVIFDTDMFHMGGLTNGGKRLVIRSHTKKKLL